MKGGSLWEICVATRSEAEDAVGELLRRLLEVSPTAWTELKSGCVRVSAFINDEKASSPAIRGAIHDGLRRIKACGLEVGSGRITIKRVRPKNWAEAWKRHFKPITIGDALLIKPSWSKRRPRAGQGVVVLDPGLSFGTGQHPTTEFCLRQLVAHRDPARQQAFLDIGTGSGILAIAAAKLGYASVHAFDLDPQAVRVARANASANRVQDKIRIVRADLTKLSGDSAQQYKVICANLLANLLIAERDRILSHVKSDGVLVVAGILKREFTEVRRAYEAVGLRLVTSKVEKEWRSGTFARVSMIDQEIQLDT